MAYAQTQVIDIDKAQCGSVDSANFEFLLVGTFPRLRSVANGGEIENTVTNNGVVVPADFAIFDDAIGTNPYPFDAFFYNPVTGFLAVIALLPNLTVASNTQAYGKWGDASVTTYQGGSLGDAYSADINNMLHMTNDGSALVLTDSTANGIDGANVGTATIAAGLFDGAAGFNGSSQGISFASSAAFATAAAPFSATVYFYNNDLTTDLYQHVFTLKSDTGSTAFECAVSNQGGYTGVIFGSAATWGQFRNNTGGVPATGTWHRATISYNGMGPTNAANFKIWIDGVNCGVTGANGFSGLTNLMTVALPPSGGGSNLLYGRAQGFVTRNVEMTDSRELAEWNNASNPTGFFTFVPALSGTSQIDCVDMEVFGSLGTDPQESKIIAVDEEVFGSLGTSPQTSKIHCVDEEVFGSLGTQTQHSKIRCVDMEVFGSILQASAAPSFVVVNVNT